MLGQRFTTLKHYLLLKTIEITNKIVKKNVLPGFFNSRVEGFSFNIIDKYKSNFVTVRSGFRSVFVSVLLLASRGPVREPIPQWSSQLSPLSLHPPALGDMFPYKHETVGKFPFPIPPIPGWDPDTSPWDDYLYPPLNPKPRELTHHRGGSSLAADVSLHFLFLYKGKEKSNTFLIYSRFSFCSTWDHKSHKSETVHRQYNN